MAASLTSTSTQPTSNILTTMASYEILFTTATAGTIKTVTVTFPAGYVVGSAILIERAGIGAGGLSASGTTLAYTVSSPVRIAAGTPIRLELATINHPSTPGTYSISITTKDSLGNTIDGPTTGTSSVVQIGTAAIANGAVTTSKLGANSVTTNSIANGAVTNPIIAKNSINSTQLGANSVTTNNIIDGSVTRYKIAHGAVSITVGEEDSSPLGVPPNGGTGLTGAFCPSGMLATGGGYKAEFGLQVFESIRRSGTSWQVSAYNPTPSTKTVQAEVECMKLYP